jgi:hypothetical protein
MDPDIPELMSTARPEKLLKNDGTIVKEIVHSVSVPEPKNAKTNRAFDTGTKIFTFKSFLSANAMRSTNSLDGLDDCSSNNSTTCAVQSIHVPILVAAMGGYHFVRDQEIIFDKSASTDKDYVVIEGALHGYTPCTECEKTHGQEPVRLHRRLDQQALLEKGFAHDEIPKPRRRPLADCERGSCADHLAKPEGRLFHHQGFSFHRWRDAARTQAALCDLRHAEKERGRRDHQRRDPSSRHQRRGQKLVPAQPRR